MSPPISHRRRSRHRRCPSGEAARLPAGPTSLQQPLGDEHRIETGRQSGVLHIRQSSAPLLAARDVPICASWAYPCVTPRFLRWGSMVLARRCRSCWRGQVVFSLRQYTLVSAGRNTSTTGVKAPSSPPARSHRAERRRSAGAVTPGPWESVLGGRACHSRRTTRCLRWASDVTATWHSRSRAPATFRRLRQDFAAKTCRN